MTPAERARLRELRAKATPGPWTTDTNHVIKMLPDGTADYLLESEPTESGSIDEMTSNAEICAAAVNALPSLLDTADRLEAEITRLNKDVSLLVAANDAKLELLKQQEAENARLLATFARLEEWTHLHGFELVPPPGAADTFGDGMRKAKRQVGNILGKALGEGGST